MTQSLAACSYDETLVHEVQTHLLEALCPLFRPEVEHEVELPEVVHELTSQLLKCKVSFCLACSCKGSV